MSGGSIGNYGFRQTEHAAEDLRNEVVEAFNNDYYKPETIAQLAVIASLMELAAQAWKDADWLISGDASEANWLSERVKAWMDAEVNRGEAEGS